MNQVDYPGGSRKEERCKFPVTETKRCHDYRY